MLQVGDCGPILSVPMLLSRVLGAIGRFCISLGLLTLLFVAYQLWGTGILTAQAQNDLENDFEELVEEAQDLDVEALNAAAELANPDLDEPVEPTPAQESAADREAREAAEAAELEKARAELAVWAELLWRPNGEAVAKMQIPKIGLDQTIVAGVGTEELKQGPGHYPGTPLPGMPGNVGIAGHRTTWGAPFNRIDELAPGDEIYVQTLQGDFTYRVIEQETGKGHFIVSPDRVDVLDQDFEVAPNRITLTACHPKFSARQRIIVVAELVGEPAPFIPPPDLLEIAEPRLASETVGGAENEDAAALPGDADLPTDEPDEEAIDELATADSEPTENPPEDLPAQDREAEQDPDEEALGAPVGDDSAGPMALQGFAATDDFGEGLNGDRSAIGPAILWGLAAAAIALTAGFAARRWRKLPSYALGIVPFAIVLFVCFMHIDQALPSY